MKTFIAVSAIAVFLAGCSHDSPKAIDHEANAEIQMTSEEVRAQQLKEKVDADFFKKAYEQGVRDTLNEYKARMRARSEYVWEPPLVQNVMMPARVIGGTFYPAHEEMVIIKPGRWVVDNGLPAPDVKPQSSTSLKQETTSDR